MTSTLTLRAAFLIAASLAGAPALAQFAEGLPPPPAYRGEIRRGPDGELRAIPATEPVSQAGPIAAPTLIVGPGERVTTIGEAARLARDGEIIEIRPGVYRGQPAVWTQDRLVIRGSGERPVMLADGQSAEGKGIWVVRGGEVLIENIEFRGARVPQSNGAGIRFERGRLTVRGCRFVDNEMGILTANFPEQTLDVIDSEFGDAPHTPGDLHHLLYVGAIGRFVLRGSRFSGGYLGHLVKSRARENHVLYNMLVDGEGGRASYELEFPNGGLAFVIGNAIGQSATTDNPAIIAYGAEGRRWPDNALYLAHNTLVNDHFTGDFLRVWNEKSPAGVEIWQINNLLVGDGNFFPPAQGRVDGNHRAQRADLIPIGDTPLRPTSQSPLRGSVRPPGSARGVDLLPTAEFTYPVGSRPLRLGHGLAPGAFQ
ncbi:MAG: hypothetical protein FWC58_05250 [Desulfobulbus sp.]|nr:hypothetical protein [Desulfobulbus sp.]